MVFYINSLYFEATFKTAVLALDNRHRSNPDVSFVLGYCPTRIAPHQSDLLFTVNYSVKREYVEIYDTHGLSYCGNSLKSLTEWVLSSSYEELIEYYNLEVAKVEFTTDIGLNIRKITFGPRALSVSNINWVNEGF